MRLTEQERHRIDACIAAFEARTGAQVVTAVVDKADDYPEILWKAFALGAAFAALVRVLLDFLRPDWLSAGAALVDALAILGCGALLAAASVTVHALGRLFLHRHRAEAEVLSQARSLFLAHELFATPARNGILILVSRFERRVAILPDAALRGRVDDSELHAIINGMTPMLAHGQICDALCHGVQQVEALLLDQGFRGRGGAGRGLRNEVIEEAGDAGHA